MSLPDAAEDRRLATLHLRLGGLSLARAELEDLHRRGELDAPGLADLAEARWRSGDLESGAVAALDHLGAGGSRPIARVIAAEAAAAAGRPVEARAHVEALGPVNASALEPLFAGMPRRANWPSAPNAPLGPPATMFEAERSALSMRRPPSLDRLGPWAPPGASPASAAASGASELLASDGQPVMAGLWAEDEPGLAGRDAGRGPRRPAEPAEELARAREELDSGDPTDAARGLARLTLVLRLDPALAADVLGALGPGRDAGALLVRGDACRLLGRHVEAEAAFAAAARALEVPSHRARPS